MLHVVHDVTRSGGSWREACHHSPPARLHSADAAERQGPVPFRPLGAIAMACCCGGVLLACHALQVGGKPVGVHVSHSRSLDQLVEEQLAEIQGDADPEASINKLLRLVRSHSDRKSAVAAALKAVLALPARKEAQPLGVGVAQVGGRPQTQRWRCQVASLAPCPLALGIASAGRCLYAR